LYRWHATTSQADEKWVEQLMGHIFPHKSIDTVSRTLDESIDVFTQCDLQLTIQDFKDAVVKVQAEEPDITHWTFGK
jgi:hypothetical protein